MSDEASAVFRVQHASFLLTGCVLENVPLWRDSIPPACSFIDPHVICVEVHSYREFFVHSCDENTFFSPSEITVGTPLALF
jgi:hypothetical protein